MNVLHKVILRKRKEKIFMSIIKYIQYILFRLISNIFTVLDNNKKQMAEFTSLH